MSTIDHPNIKVLIQNAAKASQLMAPSPERDLIAHLTHALAEVHEVAVGADHTAAKYWTRLTAAEREAERVRAALEEAHGLIGNHSGDLNGAALDAWRILSDALNDKEAEK